MIRKSIFIAVFALVFSGCVNTPAQFKPAGFQSSDEAQEYVTNYLYYANKLTPAEWEAFYRRFPEYWKDIQTAKQIGGSMDFHPWYTAYAFKWTTLRKKQTWEPAMVLRLEQGELLPGDDIYKSVFGRGTPFRVIWDNDFELLIYKSGKALIFNDGVFSREKYCSGCSATYDQRAREGMTEDDVIAALGLQRPTY